MELKAGKQLRMVRHELDINMLLQHPNVVRCHDYQVSSQDAAGVPAATDGSSSFVNGSGSIHTPTPAADWGQDDSRNNDPSCSGSGGSQAAPSVSIISQHTSSQAASAGLETGARAAGSAIDHLGHTPPDSMVQVSVLRVALDVARGMAHLHEHKVCHGDLSSNNVLLCSSPDVPAPLVVVAKVADFGLSRLLPEQGTHLSTLTCGTITHVPTSSSNSTGSAGRGSHAQGSSSAASTDPSSAGQAALPLCKSCPWDSALACPPSVGDAYATGSPALVSRLSSTDSQPSSSVGPLISSVYQDLRAAPWTIATRVMQGMRPVFTAPAVPGPYMQLAQRCWQADPALRPTFNEIVTLLETVVDGDSTGAVSGSGPALPDPSDLVESF
eukprot:gene2471-2774_t